MREAGEPRDALRGQLGAVPTAFTTHRPQTIPRVDYERIFVMDSNRNLLGEYALNDDCPLESSDLLRSLPVSGLRHLVSFYQGEYAFTPFKVDDLWFVILTHGVPRIEERGSVGTLLAAARIHLPPMMDPFLAKKETELREKEQELEGREKELLRREQRAGLHEVELQLATTRLREMESDLRGREMKLATLRDYAVQLQQSIVSPKDRPRKDRSPAGDVTVSPS